MTKFKLLAILFGCATLFAINSQLLASTIDTAKKTAEKVHSTVSTDGGAGHGGIDTAYTNVWNESHD